MKGILMKATGERTIVTDDPMETRYRLVFDDMSDGDITALSIIHRLGMSNEDCAPTTARVMRLANNAIREMLDMVPADGESVKREISNHLPPEPEEETGDVEVAPEDDNQKGT